MTTTFTDTGDAVAIQLDATAFDDATVILGAVERQTGRPVTNAAVRTAVLLFLVSVVETLLHEPVPYLAHGSTVYAEALRARYDPDLEHQLALATSRNDTAWLAELEQLGQVRVLAPEQAQQRAPRSPTATLRAILDERVITREEGRHLEVRFQAMLDEIAEEEDS